MRERLDPVKPECLRPLFKHVFGALQRGKVLEEMVFVEGHYLLVPGHGVAQASPKYSERWWGNAPWCSRGDEMPALRLRIDPIDRVR